MEEASYLISLNQDQRAAVTFDVPPEGRAGPGRPLLIIAGAGSGKTNTLAHRVAHLILGGADPRRLLLLTFTRRGRRGDEQAGRADLRVGVLGIGKALDYTARRAARHS